MDTTKNLTSDERNHSVENERSAHGFRGVINFQVYSFFFIIFPTE